jgi:GNAT superfamily N-acetyltransferase
MNIIIRKGCKEDLPAILNLITELAVFEKAPDEVAVSLAEMEKWGFGAEALYEFFVAEVEEQIVGMALSYYKYSTWKGKCLFLEDIIVTEAFRGKGIGKLLFREIALLAKAKKVRRLEWQVLDWNSKAIEFYKSYNAVLDDEWINCKLTESQISLFPDN